MSDWLAPFRARENEFRGNAVALLRAAAPADNAALRIALAWQSAEVEWAPPDEACPASEAAIWRWIWHGVDVDDRALALAAGVAPDDVRHYLPQLISNRLIYPDGTVSGAVLDVASRMIVDSTLPKGLG